MSSDIRAYTVKFAILYGPDCATFINHLQYRIGENRKHQKYFYDGRYWTYNSTSSLIETIYPYWTKEQMNRIIKKLVDAGVILVGNYNKMPGDRTRWYAFVDEDFFLGPLNLKKSEIPRPRCKNTLWLQEPKTEDLSPETIDNNQGAKTHHPRCENTPAIPLINFNKISREGALEKSASPLSQDEVVLEKNKNGTRLSPSWELPEKDREWAVERGLFNEQVDNQAEIFKNYWIAKPGKAGLSLDWSANWRNWLLKDKSLTLTKPIKKSKVKVEDQQPQQPTRTSNNPLIQKWYDMEPEFKEEAEARLGKGIYVSWLSPIDCHKITPDRVIFMASTKFIAERVNTNYREIFYDFMKKIVPSLGTGMRYPEDCIEIIYPEHENASL